MHKLIVPACIAALSLLAACQTVTTAVRQGAPNGADSTPAPDAVRYTVDVGHSELRFLIYKAGALAAFGHDHTVDAHGFTGEIYLAPQFDASSSL